MTFNDDYKLISGWIHDFYCDKDGAELIFEENNSSFFLCPLCHLKYDDLKRKRAWILKYRYKVFQDLENKSFKFLETKSKEDLEYIIEVLKFYAINYEKFLIHDKDGNIYQTESEKNTGRITSQGLNEAMVMIRIVKTVFNVDNYLDNNLKKVILEDMFDYSFKLLKPQVKRIHNIDFYIVIAIGMMGILSDNKEMLDFAFRSDFSIFKQLEEGVTKDYFWYEGSFHYHMFILKPILEMLIFVKKVNYKIDDKYYRIVKKMIESILKVTFNDSSFPSPNDGWPNRGINNYIEVFALAKEVFRGCFKINTKTCHFVDTGFSMLKNEDYQVFVKYGGKSCSHAHPDFLNLEIKIDNYFLTHDLSTSGYGSDISKNYYKKTYAHNTVVIRSDDHNKDTISKILLKKKNRLKVEVNNLNGWYALRDVKIEKNILEDYLTVNCSEEKVDYFFHVDALLISDINLVNSSLKEYPYLENVKKLKSKDPNVKLFWKLGNKTLCSEIDTQNKELFICKSPLNPNISFRTTLVIRSNSVNPIFRMKWNIGS